MLYVDYGKVNLYGLFECKRAVNEQIITCNVYHCNGLLAWVARQYADVQHESISTYLWGFFNDENHVKNSLGLTKGYEGFLKDYLLKITLRKDTPKRVIKACQLISKTLMIDISYVDDLDEYIYECGGSKDDE